MTISVRASRSGATIASTFSWSFGPSASVGKSAITAAAPPSADTSVPTKRGSANVSARSRASPSASFGTSGISLRTSTSPSTSAIRLTLSAARLHTLPRASSGMASSREVMRATFPSVSGVKTSPLRGTTPISMAAPPPKSWLMRL